MSTHRIVIHHITACFIVLGCLVLPLSPADAATATQAKPKSSPAKTVTVSSAPTATLNELSEMEHVVFHRQYPSESPEKRASRLETFFFGEAKPANTGIETRLSALRKILPARPSEKPVLANNSPASPQAQTQSQSQTIPAGQSNVPVKQTIIQPNAPEDDNDAQASTASAPPPFFTPQVMEGLNLTEQRVYGQTFPNDNPETRLSRLEMRLFNETASEMEPEERLYRVASVLKAQNSSQQEKVAGNGFLPPANLSRVQAGSGIYINGVPLGAPNAMGARGGRMGSVGMVDPYGNIGYGRGRTSGRNNILPSLLMILLQSLL